jgi:glyoxylate/hydroxypyruvate reductase A
VLFYGRNMDAGPWIAAFREALPNAAVEAWSPAAPPADYLIVWMPSQDVFEGQTSLKAIFNLGAGIDALRTLDLPAGVPLVRITDAGMAVRMAEYVLHAIGRHYRQFEDYERDIAAGVWQVRPARPRAECPVGVMGLGALGARVARAIAQFDFPVAGWSRSPRTVPGVECFSGAEGLGPFLGRTSILVCLLPLTPETDGILNRATLSQLRRGGYLINVARGAHLVDDDLLALVDSGQLSGATLDVFRTEPLPLDHPFWRHPAIRITPHVSARTLRDESVAQVARRILALDRGEAIEGVVDRTRGY